MKFFEESLTESLLDEAKPLLQKHWAEIAHYKDLALNPDYTTYLLMEKLKLLRTYCARHEDGSLVGYAVFVVQKNPHYQQTIWAKQDIIFIDPAYRGRGMLFVKWCEDQLKELGVDIISHHVKLSHNWGRGLEHMGYESQDIIYTKRIK